MFRKQTMKDRLVQGSLGLSQCVRGVYLPAACQNASWPCRVSAFCQTTYIWVTFVVIYEYQVIARIRPLARSYGNLSKLRKNNSGQYNKLSIMWNNTLRENNLSKYRWQSTRVPADGNIGRMRNFYFHFAESPRSVPDIETRITKFIRPREELPVKSLTSFLPFFSFLRRKLSIA